MCTHAILGATGKVGLTTCTTLRQADRPVRAILHSASKSTLLHALGCEVALANLHEPISLTKALTNASTIQIILPLDPSATDPLSEMQKSMDCLVSALEIVQPKRLLLISDYGAHVEKDIGIPSIFHAFEERLSKLGGKKVFLRSAEHMENWARIVPVVKGSGTLPTFFEDVNESVPSVCKSDVGKVAAELLMEMGEGEEAGTRVVHVEGPRRYSVGDVAKELGELLGRDITAQPIPREQWDDVLRQGAGENLCQLLIKTSEAQNERGLVDVEPGVGDVRKGSTELKEVLQSLLSEA